MYKNLVDENKDVFKDGVVLSLGAMMSVLPANVGAKHIYVVECSSRMIDMAKQIVETNGFSNVITILEYKKKEGLKLPVPTVDVIVFEWKGYFLLHEDMLKTVLYARAMWLALGGIVFPSKASLFLTAIEDADNEEHRIECWKKNVDGLDMSHLRRKAIMEPFFFYVVDPNKMVTSHAFLKTIDVDKKMYLGDDASFSASFKLVAQRDDCIHALVTYFNVNVTDCDTTIGFSTGPKSRNTWKQAVLFLEDELVICKGEALVGSLAVNQNWKSPGVIDLLVHYTLRGKRCKASRVQMFRTR